MGLKVRVYFFKGSSEKFYVVLIIFELGFWKMVGGLDRGYLGGRWLELKEGGYVGSGEE